MAAFLDRFLPLIRQVCKHEASFLFGQLRLQINRKYICILDLDPKFLLQPVFSAAVNFYRLVFELKLTPLALLKAQYQHNHGKRVMPYLRLNDKHTIRSLVSLWVLDIQGLYLSFIVT